MNDMYELMDRWGAWAADESNGVDWQPVAAGFKGLLPPAKEYELVIAHFVIGISLRAIAKKRKCADGTIRKELQTAMGFISGVLSMI